VRAASGMLCCRFPSCLADTGVFSTQLAGDRLAIKKLLGFRRLKLSREGSPGQARKN